MDVKWFNFAHIMFDMGYSSVTILLQTRFSILHQDGRLLRIKINSSSAQTHEFPRDHVVDSNVLPYFAYPRFIHLILVQMAS
jgi:hypothetical protein